MEKKSGSLTQRVAAEITARIRAGDLAPGEKLATESEIMRQYGVSRTVVREAVSRLQATGWVETRHGIGTFVLTTPGKHSVRIGPTVVTTIGGVLKILELRIGLETEAAALVAVRRNDLHLGELRRALDTFKAGLQKGANTVEQDYQYHLVIANATGNQYFADILSSLGTAIIPRSHLLAPTDQVEYLIRISNEHEDIYNAIQRRDSEAARAAMRNHLTNSRERYRRALPKDGDR